MYKIIKYFLLCTMFAFLIGNANAQDNKKLAQTGMKFLSANMDARTAGLSDAVTSYEDMGPAMSFLNPAGVARQENLATASIGHMSWIADIKYYYAAVSFAPANGRFGVFTLNLQGVNYGDLNGTVRADNDQGFLETGKFSPYAYTFGLYYAYALSEKFSIGGGVKYIDQYLGPVFTYSNQAQSLVGKDNEKKVLAYDFGLIYKTGFKSLAFGMSVRNFSTEIQYEKEQFQLPLTFKIGLSMNMLDLLENIDKEQHSFNLGLDAVHYRDYSEQICIGGEYTFMKTVAFRAGVSFPNDERSYTLGIGLKQNFSGYGVAIDYAYAPFGIFDPVHRFSVKFSL